MASYEEQHGMLSLPDPIDNVPIGGHQASTSSFLGNQGSTATVKAPCCFDVHGRPVVTALPPTSQNSPNDSTTTTNNNNGAGGGLHSSSTAPTHAVLSRYYTPFRQLYASSPEKTKSFVHWYVQQGDHLRAVTTAEFFHRQSTTVPPSTSSRTPPAAASSSSSSSPADRARRAASASPHTIASEEGVYWSLFQTILHDAERSALLHPEVIGIENTPVHRRWFLSHYAHIQYLLMNQPVLRVANTLCLWLEETYRASHPSDPRLHNSDESIVLRQLILTYVRGGELYKAIDAAVACRDCAYSCLLSAAQLQTVEEPWMSETRVVPLFGEYGHGGLAQTWTGNSHRLENLSLLFEEASQHVYARASHDGSGAGTSTRQSSAELSFEAVIGAALCGHLDVLESAFLGTGGCERWQDVVWCYLRSMLIIAFTKHLMCCGHAVEPAYATYIESFTGTQDGWEGPFTEKLLQGLVERLQRYELLQQTNPTADVLQLRLILQSLCSRQNAQAEWFKALQPTPGSGDEARLLTHTYLLQDAAYREGLTKHSVQIHAAEEMCVAMCQHVGHLALLPMVYPGDSQQQQRSAAGKANGSSLPGPCPFSSSAGPHPSGSALPAQFPAHPPPPTATPFSASYSGRHVASTHGVIALALRLQDPLHRAHVYATFMIAVREVELERGDRLRGEVEEEEAQMVRLFVEADPASNILRQEVMRVLDQKVVNEEDYLTHDKNTERLLWEAMHALCDEDYETVAIHCLEAAEHFWCTTAILPIEKTNQNGNGASSAASSVRVDMGAIVTIHKILQQRVLPFLLEGRPQGGGVAGAAVAVQHVEAAHFWQCFAEAYELSAQHIRVSGELGVVVAARIHATTAGPSLDAAADDRGVNAMGGAGLNTLADRNLSHKLSQEEGALLLKLVQLTRDGVSGMRALLRHPSTKHRAISAAAVYLVELLTESVILSFLSHAHDNDLVDISPEGDHHSGSSSGVDTDTSSAFSSHPGISGCGRFGDDRNALLLLQVVFEMVERLDDEGYLATDVLPQPLAQALFTKVRTLRVTYGQRQHSREVYVVLQKSKYQ